jgi:hypothetical protein
MYVRTYIARNGLLAGDLQIRALPNFHPSMYTISLDRFGLPYHDCDVVAFRSRFEVRNALPPWTECCDVQEIPSVSDMIEFDSAFNHSLQVSSDIIPRLDAMQRSWQTTYLKPVDGRFAISRRHLLPVIYSHRPHWVCPVNFDCSNNH